MKESIDSESIREYRVSKSVYIFIIAGMAVIGIGGIRECIISPEILSERTLLLSIIGLVVISAIIYSIINLLRNEVVLKLTSEAIEHNGVVISWSSISNLKLKSQYDGDMYNYDIILNAYESDITISIDHLGSGHKEISKEIGKYYWNWKVRSMKNPSNK